MTKILPFRTAWAIAMFLIAAVSPRAQVVNRGAVEAFLMDGEITQAQKSLESYLGNADLTYQDSVYILKNLGVLYSSTTKRKELGDRYFYRLLDLDPFASIHDTYASNSILARFRNIRKAYQQQKGGKALVPAVVVFDFDGTGLKPGDGAAMGQQFIAEMQRLEVFHTLDRSSVMETLEKMRKPAEKCLDKECRLDIARRLTADKLITVNVGRVDSVLNITLTYIDVETAVATTVIRKVYSKPMEKILAEGFGELASELQDKEAAWLNLTVTPTNTLLTIDNSPMAAIASRVPLNPGKHKVCGASPGYETVCKEFEVKRADALTYALVLPVAGGLQVQAPKHKADEDVEEDEETGTRAPEGKSHGFIWWTLGSMAALALTLAIVFNTK
jgi:hypothetical protein